MRRQTSVIYLVIIFVMVASLFGAVPAQADDRVRVFVQFAPGQKANVQTALHAIDAEIHYTFDKLNAFAVSLPDAAIQGLRRNPNVVLIEADPLREAIGARPAAEATNPQTVPYGVEMVQALEVWDTDHNGVVDEGAPTGANRTICIIDSGLDITHEDIQGVSVTGYDGNLPWATDGYGHGTHVAGTMAAMNNSLGVVGVTPGAVNLYIVRVFGDNGKWAYASDLIDAANHCQAAGAHIISMSLSGNRPSDTEELGFDTLYANGILSVAAAGNAGTSNYAYPASYDSVVAVAAIDSNMEHASFSQYNDQVELSAPGVAVLSTVPGDLYEFWDGTSMATPHVSAVAALVWSSDTSLTPAQVRSALQASALDLGDPARDVYYGCGLVQAKAALDYLAGGVVDPTSMRVASLSASTVTTKSGWTATVTITVKDSLNKLIPGAVVAGTINNTTVSCTTGTNGECSVSAKLKRTVKSATYQVTGVTKSGYIYDANNSVTSIAIAKP